MWAAFGLAFMTKGPPGLLPLLGIVPFVGIRRGRAGLRWLLWLPGPAIFAVVAFTWYAIVTTRIPGLASHLLGSEVWDRVVSGRHHRNAQWYRFSIYLLVLVAGALPWTLSLLAGMRRAGSLFRPTFWRQEAREDAPGLLLLLWFLLPLAVLCASSSRLPLYVLPLFAPLSMLIARRVQLDLSRRRLVTLLAAWVVLLPALRWVSAFAAPPIPTRELAADLARFGQREFGTRPQEAAFVGCRAPYSLAIYLGADIERVNFSAEDRPGTAFAPPSSLLEEIDQPETGRLFLTKKPGRFTEIVAAANRTYRMIGETQGYTCFRVDSVVASGSRKDAPGGR